VETEPPYIREWPVTGKFSGDWPTNQVYLG
jgi:hypothetical protein